MKRRMQLITAFLLMLTMAVSCTYVFAGASDEPGDVQEGLEVTEPAPDQPVDLEGAPELEAAPEGVESEDGEEVEGPVDAAGAVDATDEVEPPAAVEGTVNAVDAGAANVSEDPGEVEPMTMANGMIVATSMMYNTTKRDPGEIVECAGGTKYYVCPITVSTNGKLYAAVTADGTNSRYVSAALGTFNTSTNEFTYSGRTWSLSPGESYNGIGGIDVVAGNTYYVGVQSSAYGKVNVQPYVYSYATRLLPAGLTMLTSGYKGNYADSAALFQIKPSKTGYIRVVATEYGNSTSAGYFTLLNASKKAISDKLWYYSASKTSYVAFGVKKGATYYLKANNITGYSSGQYAYGIQYKVYGSALRKNTTKKKAKTLKRKAKFISTAIPANGKKGNQWYKFKVPKKQATQIRINMANVKSGKIKATVYYGKKKVASTSLVNGTTNTLKLTYSTSYGKAKKGTYYLKLSKSAKTNGSYKIRYLK